MASKKYFITISDDDRLSLQLQNESYSITMQGIFNMLGGTIVVDDVIFNLYDPDDIQLY